MDASIVARRDDAACRSRAARTQVISSVVAWPPVEGCVVAKKVLTWVAIAFALFYVLSAPDDAANAVKSAGNGLRNAADAIAAFFNALFAS